MVHHSIVGLEFVNCIYCASRHLLAPHAQILITLLRAFDINFTFWAVCSCVGPFYLTYTTLGLHFVDVVGCWLEFVCLDYIGWELITVSWVCSICLVHRLVVECFWKGDLVLLGVSLCAGTIYQVELIALVFRWTCLFLWQGVTFGVRTFWVCCGVVRFNMLFWYCLG